MGKVSAGRVLTEVDESKRVAIAWLLVAAWAAVIFLMSSNTSDDLSDPSGILGIIKQLIDNAQLALFGPGIDLASSVAHFVEYMVLGMLLYHAIRLSARERLGSGDSSGVFPAYVVLLAVAAASLYGVTDEIHQLFVPGRFCDPMDWAVDTAGAMVGALGCRKLSR